MAASFVHSLAFGVVALLVYVLLKGIYRSTLHPLAGFPGPKLWACTSLFSAALDCIPFRPFKSVVRLLPALHETYGPIVRVRPDELHIHDWEAYCEIFKPRSRFGKDPVYYNSPALNGSFFNVVEVKQAKAHRDLYLPQFSKAKVNKLEGLIHDKLNLFFTRLESNAAKGAMVKINQGFNCLTTDTVMYWTYQESFGALDAPGFECPLVADLEALADVFPMMWCFPNFGVKAFHVITRLPESIKRTYFAGVAGMEAATRVCASRVQVLSGKSPKSRDVQDSIFAAAMNPNADKEQPVLRPDQLSADAMLMFAAGAETTAKAMTFATWHLLHNPDMVRQLQSELDLAMPDANEFYSQSYIEKLPFLRGVVKEAVRMSYGASARLMRLTPPEGAYLCGQNIPGGTTISCSSVVYNNDPAVFEEPHAFRPERWSGDNVAELEARMISFSRGSRSCMGMNVAYAELYIDLAHLFRRYNLKIAHVRDDFLDWRDCFVPSLNGNMEVYLEKR